MMIHRAPKSYIRRTLLLAAVALVVATSAPATAQSVSLGADIVSRYVWRGLDFGESMSVQPGLTVSLGKIEFGAWGSYSVSAGGTGHGHGAAANENDLWASFTHEFESGASLSLGVTDYYFPGPGADDFRDGDAHKQEVWASLSGSESVPLSVYAGLLLDDDEGDDCDEGEDCSTQTLYIEVGAPLMEAEGVELAAHLGVVGNESDFYGTDGAALVNVGVTASTELSITESFAPPVSVSYVVNPSEEVNRAYLFFMLSISP